MILISCIAIFSVQLIVALLLFLAKSKPTKQINTAPIESISFLIPFHNEAKRIKGLIQSINQSVYNTPCEFIFINDNSTDNTAQIIAEKLTMPYQLLSNKHKRGKKSALKTGVKAAKFDFIITWDADIIFDPNYINNLFKLPKADLIILPVRMQSKSIIGKLGCIEFSFLESFGMGLGKIGKPTLCYGANLGFSKTAFLDVDKQRTDYKILSGDDLFLLKAMQKSGKQIAVYSDESLSVKTIAPLTLRENIQQRQRWYGKMNDLFTKNSILALLLLVVVQIAGFITLGLSFYNPIFLGVFGIKISAEIIASWSFIKLNGGHIFILILHQFYYPIYLIALLIPLKKESRWS